MYLALHHFHLAPYSGVVIATGLPRPSAMRKIWDEMFLEFDENLDKHINDPRATRIPGLADVPSGLESALKLEMARSHCLRRFQKIFQNHITLGICASMKGSGHDSVLVLPHPGFSFAFLDPNGNLNELRMRGSSPNGAWAEVTESRSHAWCLANKGASERSGPIREIAIDQNHCFRVAQFLLPALEERIFSFSLSSGGLGGT